MHADGSYGRNALDKNGNNGPRREESLPGSKKDGGASDLLAESSGRQRKGVCRGEKELDWSNLSNFYFCPYLSISPTSPTLPRYESCYILFFVFIRKRLVTLQSRSVRLDRATVCRSDLARFFIHHLRFLPHSVYLDA